MAILTPNKLFKDIDFTFSAHPETKDVLKKTDVNAVKQSLRALLFTRPGERLFQPQIGSGIHQLLFEPIDYITSEALRRDIEYTIRNFEPRIQLDQVDVVPFYDENHYEITIFFTVLGVNQPASITTTLERLR